MYLHLPKTILLEWLEVKALFLFFLTAGQYSGCLIQTLCTQTFAWTSGCFSSKKPTFWLSKPESCFWPGNLNRTKKLVLYGFYLEPGLRAVFRKDQFFLQANISTLLYRLQQREGLKTSFTGYAPGAGLMAGMAFSRSNRPSSKLFLKTDSKYYERGVDPNLLRKNTVHRLQLQGEHQFYLGWFQPGIIVKAVNILNETGSPVKDNLVMDSVGGPELFYNRLIGFAFSAFRSSRYMMISVKLPVLMLGSFRSEFLFDRAYLNSDITPVADGIGLHNSYKANWGQVYLQLGRTLYPNLDNWQFYGGFKTFLWISL